MRSLQSMVVEGLIKIIMRQADPTTYMEKRRKENASPYVLPVNSQKKYRIKKLSSYSLDTYMLKSASNPDKRQILFLPGGDISSSRSCGIGAFYTNYLKN